MKLPYTAILTIIPFFIFNKSFSTELLQSDTTKYSRTETVIVIDDKIHNEPINKYAPTSIITREEISKSGILQVNELFSKIPGVHIKNYGGLGGMKTISTRGATSSQTLVMIDGMPISNSQNGGFDLSVYPISLIDKVELSRGGQSSKYGSQAIGGTVNFITEIPMDKIAGAAAKYGSFDEIFLSAYYNIPFNNSLYAINLERTQCDGSYLFDFMQFGNKIKIARKNAQFENSTANFSHQYRYDNTTLKNNLLIRKTSRGIPGAVLQGRIENTSTKLDEEEIIYNNSINFVLGNSSLLRSNAIIKFSQMIYYDNTFSNYNNALSKNLFISRDIAFNTNYSAFWNNYSYELSSNFSYSDLRGNMLDPAVDGFASRINPAISAHLVRLFISDLFNITTFLSGRIDFSDNSKPAYSPSIGADFNHNNTSFNLKLFLSRNFRLPNFNEMYYLNYGTSKLNPESSISGNIYASYCFLNNNNSQVTVNLSIFYIDTKDKIVAIPKSQISWTAANIDRTNNYGIEFSALSSFKRIFVDNLGLNYTLQFPKNMTKGSDLYNKLLPYQPQEIISLFSTIDIYNVLFHSSLDYSSFRYIQPDNSKRSVLPSYLLLNIGISKSIEIRTNEILVRFDVVNLTDVQYSIVKNYPMPGRQLRLSLNYDLKR